MDDDNEEAWGYYADGPPRRCVALTTITMGLPIFSSFLITHVTALFFKFRARLAEPIRLGNLQLLPAMMRTVYN